MTMSRKHYIAIAEAIREAYDRSSNGYHVDTIGLVATLIADALKNVSPYDLNGNKRFDRDRFLAACGL